MSKINEKLLKDLESFIRSSATNVEWMSEGLRSVVNVPTNLEDVAAKAMEKNLSIVLAGTAGSGKTHLLRSIPVDSSYKVIPDLSAVSTSSWRGIFSKKVIVAGNEGAFLFGAKKEFPGFKEVVDALHKAQQGLSDLNAGPVVVDAAGFDPAGAHVIQKIVQLPILETYVARRNNGVGLAGWHMFRSEDVAARLAMLVEKASAQSQADGFTFRQIWQFVAALVNAASSDRLWFDEIAISPGVVARGIAEIVDPRESALPHIGNQLWHRDLLRLRPNYIECTVPVLERLLAQHSRAESERRIGLFESLRLFSIFGLKKSKSPLEQSLNRGSDVWRDVNDGMVSTLLKAINQYFGFRCLSLGDDLELWLQHETERRELKPNVQISLGAARASEFEIVFSNVVGNCYPGITQIRGGRRILKHLPSGALLVVTKDLVDGMLRARDAKMRDRQSVEFDWRVTQFFEEIAAHSARSDRLRVAIFDFNERRGRLAVWQISDKLKSVEG